MQAKPYYLPDYRTAGRILLVNKNYVARRTVRFALKITVIMILAATSVIIGSVYDARLAGFSSLQLLMCCIASMVISVLSTFGFWFVLSAWKIACREDTIVFYLFPEKYSFKITKNLSVIMIHDKDRWKITLGNAAFSLPFEAFPDLHHFVDQMRSNLQE